MIGVWSEQQSCGTAPVACGIWCSLRVDSVRTELNCRILRWGQWIAWCGENPPEIVELVIRMAVECQNLRREPGSVFPTAMESCKRGKGINWGFLSSRFRNGVLLFLGTGHWLTKVTWPSSKSGDKKVHFTHNEDMKKVLMPGWPRIRDNSSESLAPLSCPRP